MKKTMMSIFLVSVSLSVLSGCSTSTKNNDIINNSTEPVVESSSQAVNFDELTLPQLKKEGQKNEYLVQMNTNMGNIQLRLFPEIVPKTVENFVTHAKEGYYDGLSFHRVIDNFMIQGGDPEGNGTGGESIWGEPFKDENNHELYNIRGAIAMANSGPDTNGSQFFIVQNKDNQSDGLLLDEYPQAIIDAYQTGGAPYLDYTFEASPSSHIVFGQVYQGMDIVDKIAQVPTGENDKPTTDVIIKNIEILQEPSK